jgi:hypothetical protein
LPVELSHQGAGEIMKKLLKYEFYLDKETVLEMPKDSEILTISGVAPEIYFLFALVDMTGQIVNRRFKTFCVGNNVSLDDNLRYVTSLFPESDLLTYHIFEVVSE